MPQAQTSHYIPYGYAKLDEVFVEQTANHLIVTPNERLAREHQRSYTALQTHLGKTAWLPLPVQSMARYFREQHAQAWDSGQLNLPILSSDYLLCVAQAHAPNHTQDDVTAFCEAWSIIHAYDIDIEDPLFNTPFRREFKRWFFKVKQAVGSDFILEELLPDALLKAGVSPQQPLVFDHIDQLTTSQQRYFTALAAHQPLLTRNSPGMQQLRTRELYWSPIDRLPQTPQVVGAAGLEQELSIAADWATDIITRDPNASVGIVVPDLNRHYALTSRIIGSALDPAKGSLSDGYDISGGTPLTQLSLWQEALLFSDLCFDHIIHRGVQRLIESRHLGGDLLDALQQFASRWPEGVGTRVNARTISKFSGRDLYLPGDSTNASLGVWCQRLSTLLANNGWATDATVGSIQFQAHQQLQDALANLVSTSASSPNLGREKLSYVQARSLLVKLMQKRIFAPQRPAARIQALGLLETTGLQFTHLWVCGSDENRLPATPNVNRFVPSVLASRAGVPRISPDQEFQLAQNLIRHWIQDSGETVFSFTKVVEESEQLVSALVEQLNPGVRDLPQLAGHGLHHRQSVQLEPYFDDRGPALEQHSTTRGGTRLIEDQASCPFKAFAVHRLGLKQQDLPTDFPGARERGSALHNVLQALVTQYPDSDSLLTVPEQTITTIVSEYCASLTLPEFFVEHEVGRLVELILKWLELEAQRGPFQIVQVERNYTLDLEALAINVRIDRVDQIAGKLLVIDYKSGNVRVPSAEEIVARAPQLPLYSLLDPGIAGVYYAQLQKDHQRFAGLADNEYAIPQARHARLTGDWASTVALWRDQIRSLGRDFASGHAAVSPAKSACDYCHLASVCRIEDKV